MQGTTLGKRGPEKGRNRFGAVDDINKVPVLSPPVPNTTLASEASVPQYNTGWCNRSRITLLQTKKHNISLSSGEC